MEEKRTLLVGMDIGEQVTQISCFDFTTYEPVAIVSLFATSKSKCCKRICPV